MKLFLITISIILVSCNGQKKAALKEEKMASSETENQLELIIQEEQGGFEADDMLVIRDAKRLKLFYSKINRTRKPGLPVPDLDFLNEMIIIQCTSEESLVNSGGLSVLKETDSQIVLKLDNHNSTKDTSSAMQSGSFRIYKMPTTSKKITLEKHNK